MSDERVTDVVVVERDDTRGEWFKFIILVAIFVIVMLVIALLRPLIFNTIVPAVMGDGLEPVPTVPMPVFEVNVPVVQNGAGEAAAEGDQPQPTAETATEGTTTTDGSAAVSEETATAVPTQTHTVIFGDTLTSIASRYNTTIDAIIAANRNQIDNPNRIVPGTVLIIPTE